MIELATLEKLPEGQAYKRKHLPKKKVLQQKPGTFLRVMWGDGPDIVVMLIEKPFECSGVASLNVLTPGRTRPIWIGSDKVVSILGQITYPTIVETPTYEDTQPLKMR